ncbi:hypothetical protein [Siminovitchia sp. FSL W7-1587]|uniref:hypothetical protein n=1 Tax=Siminovitchia sp. FSL W7-1587 TaxID=2954699 RepID=UPI0030D1EFC4
MIGYKDNEMATITLERYDELNEEIERLTERVNDFEALFRKENEGGRIVINVDKASLDDWLKCWLGYGFTHTEVRYNDKRQED